MCTGTEFIEQNADKLTLAAGAMNAIGSITQGGQQRQYGKYQAAQARADASAEAQLGEVRADRVRKAGRLAVSQARAAGGASGVDVNAGSMADAQATIERNVGSDALVELLTGRRKAAALETTASGYEAAGANAEKAGYLKASNSLLGSAAQAEGQKAQLRRFSRPTKPSPMDIDYAGYGT